MKRMLHALLAATMLVSTMTFTAFAADDGYTTHIEGIVECTDQTYGSEVYTASYDKAIPGNDYVLMVVKCEDGEDYKQNLISDPANSILYIDQKTAAGSDISFDILPSAAENSVVVLSGEFAAENAASPKVLGTIIRQEPEYILGCVNPEDEDINSTDAMLVLKHFVGLIVLDEKAQLAADVNRDGNINSTDAMYILKHFVGLITEFPDESAGA